MPEPRKRTRTKTRTSTASVSDINETQGAHPQRTARAPEADLVEHADVPVESGSMAPIHEQKLVESSAIEPAAPPEPTVGIFHEGGIESLLHDKNFMTQFVHVMTESKAIDTLAEDFADKLNDALGNNPNFRQRLVNAVVSTETFKRKLARKMR